MAIVDGKIKGWNYFRLLYGIHPVPPSIVILHLGGVGRFHPVPQSIVILHLGGVYSIMRSAFFSVFVLVTISSLKSRLLIKFQVSNLSQLILLLFLVCYSFRHLLQHDSLAVQLLKSLCLL